jgi:hypothetical protein
MPYGHSLDEYEVKNAISEISEPLFVLSEIMFAAHVATYHGYIYATEVLAIAGLLASTCMKSYMRVSRWLECKHLKFVGVLS